MVDQFEKFDQSVRDFLNQPENVEKVESITGSNDSGVKLASEIISAFKFPTDGNLEKRRELFNLISKVVDFLREAFHTLFEKLKEIFKPFTKLVDIFKDAYFPDNKVVYRQFVRSKFPKVSTPKDTSRGNVDMRRIILNRSHRPRLQ